MPKKRQMEKLVFSDITFNFKIKHTSYLVVVFLCQVFLKYII